MRTNESQQEGRRVLIIEDHVDSGESLRVLLTIHGCNVRVAGDGLEGVRQAMYWRPEVVISDIGLPDLDGWQLGRQLRAALGEKTMLVAVTAFGQPADHERSRQAGYNAHVTKPADPYSLLRLIGVRS